MLVNDSRIKATVAYQPYYAIASSQNVVPVLIVTTSNDATAPYNDNGLKFYNEINSTKLMFDIIGYSHYEFPQIIYRCSSDWFSAHFAANVTASNDLEQFLSSPQIDIKKP